MSRYKGRTKTKLVERDFPHHVDMMVPEFGFGAHLDAMYDWHLDAMYDRHHARGVLALHGSGWRDENGRYCIRWCFADQATADRFENNLASSEVHKTNNPKSPAATRATDGTF